jgi:hypothetical protein
MRNAQKDIATIAAVREEFLKNKSPSLPHHRDRNLIGEPPLFSQDIDFDSTDHTLLARLEDPLKFIFKNKLTGLVVSITLSKGVTLEDGEYLYNAISKLYSRVKFYQSND